MKIRPSPTGSEARLSLRRGAGPQRGFSLLELLVVISLMTLLLGLVAPGFYRTWKREHDRASLRQIMATLRTARSLAATQRQRVRVFVDLNTGRYRLEGSPKPGVLSGVRLTGAHLVWQDQEKRQGYIAFYGDGSSSGGRLALVGAGGRRQVLQVEIITGKVSLQAGG